MIQLAISVKCLIKKILIIAKVQFYHVILFYLFFTITGCNVGFEEINTNPNAPIDVEPSLLLRQVIYNSGEEMSYEGFVAGNLLAQHFTMVDFNLFDRHDLSAPQLGGNPWPILYKNLRDNELILEKARSNSVNRVYEGPALVLKAYLAAMLTDIYGDVPYTEALKGTRGITTPRYDSQKSIYLEENGILDNLNKAIITISNYTGVQSLKGDILYNGDLSVWLKLANSLKIKYLMRLSGKIAISERLLTVHQEQRFLQSNLENASFNFTDSQPNSFRMAVLRSGDFNLFVMSEKIEQVLSQYNDPRIAILFRPNDAGGFVGLNNGPDASNTSFTVSDYSLTGNIFRESSGSLDANFMTAWETHFLLAEAAYKGYIVADAKDYYELAVKQAFEYWSMEMPVDYLTSAPTRYDQSTGLAQIMTQKWIANSINGYENWIEYRRTGFPMLLPVTASLNNSLLPVRMPYPTEEEALNSENFNAATATNHNSINTAVWWDVNE